MSRFPKKGKLIGGDPLDPKLMEGADATAIENYGPVYSFKMYMKPVAILAFSFAAYLAWAVIDILGTTRTIFGSSFEDIELANTSIGSQGGELPNWLSAVTLVALGGSFAYLFTRVFLRKMEVETPFLASFITLPIVFVLNAIADGYWLKLNPLITIIMSPISLALVISIYWWRPVAHWWNKDAHKNLMSAEKRYEIAHDSEPINKLEFLCCDVPFKLLLNYQMRRMFYYVMTWGVILAMPNFNSTITTNNWYVTYVCIAAGIIILLHLLVKWDGAFGLMFGVITAIDGFILFNGIDMHTPAVIALTLGFATIVISFVACILAYEHYDMTYYRKLTHPHLYHKVAEDKQADD